MKSRIGVAGRQHNSLQSSGPATFASCSASAASLPVPVALSEEVDSSGGAVDGPTNVSRLSQEHWRTAARVTHSIGGGGIAKKVWTRALYHGARHPVRGAGGSHVFIGPRSATVGVRRHNLSLDNECNRARLHFDVTCFALKRREIEPGAVCTRRAGRVEFTRLVLKTSSSYFNLDHMARREKKV